MEFSKTRFEDLPDELLLLTYRYLRPCDLIWAFHGLNYRLNCTISHKFGSLTLLSENVTTSGKGREVLQLIGEYTRSLTLKSSTLSIDDFQSVPYLEELNYSYTQSQPIPVNTSSRKSRSTNEFLF